MDQAFVPEKTSKLIIRVKMDGAGVESVDNSDESEMEFNPVAISVLVLTVIFLLGFAYYLFVDTSGSEMPSEFQLPTSVIETPRQQAKLTQPSIPEFLPKETISTVGSEGVTSTPLQSVAETTGEIIEVEEVVVNSVTPAPVMSQTPPEKVSQVVQNTIATDVVEDNSLNDKIADSSAGSAPDTTIKSQASVVKEQPHQEPIVVTPDFSANVKRAQFTNGINKREPIDFVDSIVSAKTDGIKKIYFFTELRQLKGQTIRHQWYHEGKMESEIKFDVRGNRWRVNSSKRLNPAAMGNWVVKVVNEQGISLHSQTFEYQLP